MSPKRIVVFILLVIGAPFWVTLRSHFGERFAALLLCAWSVGFSIVWLVAGQYVPDAPSEAIYTARLLLEMFVLSGLLWIGQMGMAAMYRAALALRECEVRPPWRVGSFWLPNRAGGVLTMLGLVVMLIRFQSLATTVPTYAHQAAYGTFAVMAGSFVALLFVSGINGDRLPIQPPLPRRSRRNNRRFISTTGLTAKRSREGLQQVFSRRNQALRNMTSPSD